jgi:formate dehydrogenase alpha subunit
MSMDALLNLALMTGSVGGEGHGLYFLARENNQIGAWDMGVVPDSLPGRQPLSDDTIRNHWEQNWEVTISPDPGLNVIRMIEEAEKGNLQGLYIMGENPCRSLPQPERIRDALNKPELLVVQDILATETTQLADVVLPGAAFSEKGGTFTNLEGRIQSFEPVVPPPGEAKPDWEIFDMLFDTMRHSKRYPSLNEIRTEISQLVPMYSELERNVKTTWVKGSSNLRLFHPDAKGEPIHFSPILSPEDEGFKENYPFTGIMGSLRYHLGSGTRTGHSNRVKSFSVKGEVEISPEDSDRIHLKEGDRVKISSPYGSIVRGVTIKNDLRPGLVFIPIGFYNNDAMKLINLTQLGEADSPGWKECHVKIERLEE